MATLLSNKLSNGTSPAAYYTASVSTSNRTATSVKITFSISGRLQYSSSFLGTGKVLVAGIRVAGSWHTVTLKSSSSSWSGTGSHSASTSFTVSAAATTTTLTGIQVRVLRTDGGGTSAQLNATAVSNISIGLGATASTPSISPTSGIEFGDTITISNSSTPSTNVYTLTYSFGSASGTICTKKASPVTWTIPTSLMSQIPDATSGTITLTCQTYTSGGASVGSKTKTFTASVPTSIKPTISSVTVSEAVSSVASTIGAYVKSQSKAKVVISAAGKNGSTISKYATTIAGTNYSGSTVTSNVLNTSGTVKVDVTVTDSRGRTASTSKNITVLDYAPPGIISMSCYPCDASGNRNSDGTYTKIIIKGRVSSLIVGSTEKNSKTLTVQWKAETASSFTTLTGLTYSGTWDFEASKIISGTNPATTYEFKATLTDKLESDGPKTTRTSVVCISRLAGGKGVTLFKEATEEGFWVGDIDYTITDDEYDELLSLLGGGVIRLIDWIYPVGSIKTFATGVDPNKIYRSQTWEEVAQGRVLMGADDNHEAGTTVEAGLPNITGGIRPSIRDGGYAAMTDSSSGALYNKSENGYKSTNIALNTNSRYKGSWIYFDASRSSSVYGNSNTVQPPAYFIHYWKRTA